MNKGLLATIGLVVIGGAAVMFWQASTPTDDLVTPTVKRQLCRVPRRQGGGVGKWAALDPQDIRALAPW
jgi:hypothetical protein